MNKYVGIIGSVDDEISLLIKKLKLMTIKESAGHKFFIGTLFGIRVVIVKSGIGKVNGSLISQSLISRFPIRFIVGTGTAGSIVPYLNIGNSVLSTKTQQYDVNFKPIGFKPGIIPEMKTSVFPANPHLIQLAELAAANKRINIVKGKILSGDRFIADESLGLKLNKAFDGICVEVEGAAISQVCYLNRIPYIIIRTISDRANSSAPIDFYQYGTKAALQSQVIILNMLKKLKQLEDLKTHK